MADARRRRWLLPIAGLALLWLVLAGFSLLSANREIRKGLEVAEAARDRADASAVVEGRLLPDLRRARSHFGRAHDRVGGPLLAPARLLPFVGRQLSSVNALSRAATTVADVAIEGVTHAHPVLAETGRTNLARATSARRLGELAERADSRLGELRLGPRVGLLAPLARARNRLGDQVAELRDALGKGAKGSAAVADLLEGPRRYLVFAANNAEMRAGSGMLLSAGELETGPQGIRLGEMRSVTDIPVPAGQVPLTGDLAGRWGWLEPNVEWRNLMMSPRFDAAAPLAAQMWVAAGHRPVDGVMVLDPVALAGLLQATGPVEVDGRSFDADNIVEELLHGQYLRFPSAEEKPERREGLGRIAGALFDSLDAGDWSLTGLVSGVADAAGGRHLLLWAANPSEQAAWQALGVDGALTEDSLLVSVLSRGGNKLDPFLRLDADISVSHVEDGTEVLLRLHLRNTVPVGEPQYVAGPHARSGVGEGVYVGIVAVNVPGAAHDGRFEGVDQLAVQGDDGPTRVLGFQVELPRDGHRTVVARFRLPAGAGVMRVEPSARVPATTWRSGPTTWSDTRTKLLTWTA
ncbi:MAG TPA: DUF4012 domain-containing protein [Acidimicrobiales bacterium]|nr:DUF4012 domain-containing protein [Acidimicrobiales bacterium]